MIIFFILYFLFVFIVFLRLIICKSSLTYVTTTKFICQHLEQSKTTIIGVSYRVYLALSMLGC